MTRRTADALDAFFAALLDGGDGFDACRVSPDLLNVLVLNCKDECDGTSLIVVLTRNG